MIHVESLFSSYFSTHFISTTVYFYGCVDKDSLVMRADRFPFRSFSQNFLKFETTKMSNHIQVAVRIRPPKKETKDVSNIKINEVDKDTTSLTISEEESSHSFDFNFVFPSSTTQERSTKE